MRRTDRAMGPSGAGVPVDEIVEFTGVPKHTVYSQASRRGIERPNGELDAEQLEMQITSAAIDEALAYWSNMSRRHAEYWSSERKLED